MPEVLGMFEHITSIGDWRCDVRGEGSYRGQRVATKFKPGTLNVETTAEWCCVDEEGEPIPEDEQGMMISTKHIVGTVLVPAAVVEWLRGTKND